jgi:hypothetical protein
VVGDEDTHLMCVMGEDALRLRGSEQVYRMCQSLHRGCKGGDMLTGRLVLIRQEILANEVLNPMQLSNSSNIILLFSMYTARTLHLICPSHLNITVDVPRFKASDLLT